jgi:hypothetical protein
VRGNEGAIPHTVVQAGGWHGNSMADSASGGLQRGLQTAFTTHCPRAAPLGLAVRHLVPTVDSEQLLARLELHQLDELERIHTAYAQSIRDAKYAKIRAQERSRYDALLRHRGTRLHDA